MARHFFATWPAEAKVGPREGGVLTAVAEQNPLNYKYQNDLGNLARRNEISSGWAFERGSRSTFDTTWRGIFLQSCPQKRKYVLGREGRFSSEAAGASLARHLFGNLGRARQQEHLRHRMARHLFSNLGLRCGNRSSGGRAGIRARQREHR